MNKGAVAIACGAGMGVAAWLATRSAGVADETASAIASGGTFKARLTGYWPFAAKSEAERRMEGGHNDRKGKPLHTLEQHLTDPSGHPFVSVSGDDAIFPYGQRLVIDAWPNAVFRVVDTGGHFRGAGKVYRISGREPLDICVNTSGTLVPKEATAGVVRGDHFDKAGKEVVASRFKGQDVQVGALEMLGAENYSNSQNNEGVS